MSTSSPSACGMARAAWRGRQSARAPAVARSIATDSTALDYTYGMPVMLGMFIVLLMPQFKNALIAE